MRCAYHSNTETDLTCGRCDTPICPRCLVHTEVGIRCPGCALQERRRLLPSVIGWPVLLPLWRAIFKPPALQVLFSIATGVAWIAILSTLLGPRIAGRKSASSASSVSPTIVAMFTPHPSPLPAYDLTVLSKNCTIDRAAHVTNCSGSVRNVSGHNLENVQVSVEMLTEDGRSQTTTIGGIDYDPLLPDQESPWTVVAAFNPALTKYRLTYRTASGLPLRIQDESP